VILDDGAGNDDEEGLQIPKKVLTATKANNEGGDSDRSDNQSNILTDPD
jgi:hypothetical protein